MTARILLVLLLIVALVAGAAALTWHLAYRVQEPPHASRVVDIRDPDLFRGLGHAHAVHRTWPSLLLRQAALGELSQWFGRSAVAEDERAVQLGFAEAAQRVYEDLPESDRDRLESYARGMNDGIRESDAHLNAPIVVLNATITPWQPWHSIAVELLVLWLQHPHVDTGPDHRLQTRLGWFGGQWNHAWMARNGAVSARLLTGTAATPLLLEVFAYTDNAVVSAVTVPGTVMVPVGHRKHADGRAAWSFLMRPSIAHLPHAVGLDITYDRLTSGTDEYLVRKMRRPGDAARLPGVGGDIRWLGLSGATDTPSWIRLWESGPSKDATWSVLQPDGVMWLDGSEPAVLGSPATTDRSPAGLFVTNAEPALSAAMAMRDAGTDDLPGDTYSPFAAEQVAAFLASVPDSVHLGAAGDQALTYLRNWNATFDAAEIGASVFSALDLDADDLHAFPLARMNRAMNALTSRLGPDMSHWRWSEVYPHSLTYPGWAPMDTTMQRPTRIFSKRYAPVTTISGGHPTTGVWHAVGNAPASSAWEGLIRADGGFAFRRPDIQFDVFLGRTMRLDHPNNPVRARP